MKVVVLGATGLVGSELVKKCLMDPRITSVKLITRRSIEMNDPKIEQIIIKDLEDLKHLSCEADIFFCAIGTTIKVAKSKENFLKVDYQAVIDFAKVCHLNPNAKFALISAKGASEQSSIFYNLTKGRVEKEVLRLLTSHQVFIFRPGLLIGERGEKRFAEEIGIQFVKKFNALLPYNLLKSFATQVDLLADFMVRIALNESKTQIYEAEEIEES